MGSGKNFYNSKHKTQKQKSFNGGDRFSRSTFLFIQPRELLAHPTTQSTTQLKLMEIVSCQPWRAAEEGKFWMKGGNCVLMAIDLPLAPESTKNQVILATTISQLPFLDLKPQDDVIGYYFVSKMYHIELFCFRKVFPKSTNYFLISKELDSLLIKLSLCSWQSFARMIYILNIVILIWIQVLLSLFLKKVSNKRITMTSWGSKTAFWRKESLF